MNSFFTHITLYDLAVLGLIFTGLMLCLQLAYIKSLNRKANRFLSLALIVVVVALIKYSWIAIAAGPLLYLYVRKTNRPNHRPGWKDLIHLLPMLVFLFKVTSWLDPLVFGCFTSYLYLAYRLIPRFQQNLINTDRRRHELWRLRRLLLFVGLLWLFWIPGWLLLKNEEAVYLILALVVVSLSFFAVSWNEAGAQATLPLPKPIAATEVAQKAAWLKSVMKRNHYYRDAELSLASLAATLDIHTHELSRIINSGVKKHFNDFVNEYRVKDMIAKMQDPAYDHITLLGIAFESGFNSKSAFNRVFREVTGRSAVEYKAELKKVGPTYKLGRPAPFAAPNLVEKSNRSIMFSNYFKIAWRNIARNKAFSLINIFGLGLGIACSLLIFLWIQDERSVNTFHANGANIYSVYERVISDGKVEAGRATPGLLATELKRAIPEVKYASGYWEDVLETLFTVGDKNYSKVGTYADSDFFKMFSYPLIQGTKSGALANPDDMAISRRMAVAVFGSPEAAMGKTLLFNNAHPFKVSAVFEDLPANTSQHFDFVINWQYLLKAVDWLANWASRSPETYVQLQPGADPVKVEAKIKDFVRAYLTNTYKTGFRVELGLQPLRDVYLNSVFKDGKPDGGRIEYIRLFSLVAFFILIIACVNFMNLATARSVKRGKEVGIRKTIGAVRSKLVLQFIGEAMLLTFFAVIVAIVVVLCALPYFDDLTTKHLVLPFAQPLFWLGIAGLLLATGLVAGSYPAFFLSSLNPVTVLKGALKFSPRAVLFRKGLVVFQFVLSIVFITGTLVISRQLNYIQSKNLGFDRGNLVYMHFPYPQGLAQGYKVFKQELSGRPGVQAVDFSMQPPSYTYASTYNLGWPGKDPATKAFAVRNWVGYDYFKLMGIHFAQGRAFSTSFSTDTAGVIINETAQHMMGLKSPLGQLITIDNRRRAIVGVVHDFHFKSLHEAIEPLLIFLYPEPNTGYLFVKMEPGKSRQGLASMESVYSSAEHKFPFKYAFADEEYQKMYNAEMTVGKLSDSFSFLAIFISCLGLLGLSMFTAEQRKKEIGVRKIIGASELNIVSMLSVDIVKLVVLAALLATPLAWFGMSKWLQGFAYKIDLNIWIFLAAGLIAILIALATVSVQAIKAALANPVNSLRSE